VHPTINGIGRCPCALCTQAAFTMLREYNIPQASEENWPHSSTLLCYTLSVVQSFLLHSYSFHSCIVRTIACVTPFSVTPLSLSLSRSLAGSASLAFQRSSQSEKVLTNYLVTQFCLGLRGKHFQDIAQYLAFYYSRSDQKQYANHS